MKNLVFIMDIDIKGDGRYASSRRAAYKYSIDSWKKWSDKNDCELFVLNDLLMSNDDMGICWQRYYLFDILDSNEIEYNQVLMVDADTIVHPDCPNFFEMTEDKMCAVEFDGSWDWVLRGIENYSNYNQYQNLIQNDYWKPKSYTDSFTSNFAYPVIHPKREEIVKKLRENKVEVRPMICGSMGTQPFYVKHYGKLKLPNVSVIDNYGFYVPNNPKLSSDEILFISNIINKGITG